MDLRKALSANQHKPINYHLHLSTWSPLSPQSLTIFQPRYTPPHSTHCSSSVLFLAIPPFIPSTAPPHPHHLLSTETIFQPTQIYFDQSSLSQFMTEENNLRKTKKSQALRILLEGRVLFETTLTKEVSPSQESRGKKT